MHQEPTLLDFNLQGRVNRSVIENMPEKADQWELISLKQHLDNGCMSKVYKAELKGTDEPICVKVIDMNELMNYFEKNRGTENPFNEQLIHLRLGQYTGWVSPVCSFFDKRHFVVVYPFMDHGDMFNYVMNNEKAIPRSDPKFKAHTAEIRMMLRRAGDAICRMHDERVIHFDISLENILLDKNKSAYISDMGASKYIGNNYRIMPIGDTMMGPGKLSYMAPELHQNTRAIDPYKCDAFSFGVTVLHAFTQSNFWIVTNPRVDPRFKNFVETPFKTFLKERGNDEFIPKELMRPLSKLLKYEFESRSLIREFIQYL